MNTIYIFLSLIIILQLACLIVLIKPFWKKKADYMEEDGLFNDAVKATQQTTQVTTGFLQKRLGVGYARAARLIDMLEDRGVIGKGKGTEPRAVLGIKP